MACHALIGQLPWIQCWLFEHQMHIRTTAIAKSFCFELFRSAKRQRKTLNEWEVFFQKQERSCSMQRLSTQYSHRQLYECEKMCTKNGRRTSNVKIDQFWQFNRIVCAYFVCILQTHVLNIIFNRNSDWFWVLRKFIVLVRDFNGKSPPNSRRKREKYKTSSS